MNKYVLHCLFYFILNFKFNIIFFFLQITTNVASFQIWTLEGILFGFTF
jgi:hypothetical protein